MINPSVHTVRGDVACATAHSCTDQLPPAKEP
jgi:hypothetical protein